MSFSVEFHHMGSFVNDPTLHYEGGQVHVVHNLDIGKWSYFELLGIVKDEFGYFGDIKMWWKARELGFENGLNLITLDSHALELAKYALTNKCGVEVYIELGASLPGDVEEVPPLMCNNCNVGGGESKGKHVCDVVEDEVVEMSDGNVEDIHFDDCKEERVVAPDDGNVGGGESKGKHVCDVVEDEVVEMNDGNVEDIHFDDSKEERVVAPDDGNVGGGESKGKHVCDVVEDEVVEMNDGNVEDIHFDDSKEERVVAPDDGNVGGGESKGKHVCDVVEDEVVEMNDGNVEDIDFDDSKEERVVAPDDGFGFGNPSQLSTEHGDTCEKIRGKRKSVPAKRPAGLRRKLPMRKAKKRWTGGVDGDGGMSGNDGEIRELEEEYNTKELDSGKSVSDSKGDGASKPNYTMFKKEYMSKDFEFELGMEFGSLQEFKEAIIEHSILNGREIRFQKNDAVRVRVKCKRACNFVALVSKDASSFRMKTLVSKHTCERVFNNKNANSKWVAKVVANKFQSGEKMKIKDIIGEISSSYATGITTSRARRARQIAKGMWTASSQQPHPQGGQPTTDPVEATLKQKKATAKEQPATSQKRRKGKVAATCARKTQKSHVSTMSQQEGSIDAGPNVHTAVAQIVEPLRYIVPT